MRVLIIDDEEDTRSIFSMSLGLLGGAEVMEANNGPAGIAVAARENPDVIILDLLMPGMDGSQTFLALKNRPDTSQIPVIFMTVKGMFSEFDRLKSMGALAVIAKPFDPITLTQQIKTILTTNGFQPEDRDNFAGETNQLSPAPNNIPVAAKNFSPELNNVAAGSDPSAATGEMMISDGTNQPSGSVEDASSERKPASSTANSKNSGKGVRGKSSRPERIAQRIIAKKKPRRR